MAKSRQLKGERTNKIVYQGLGLSEFIYHLFPFIFLVVSIAITVLLIADLHTLIFTSIILAGMYIAYSSVKSHISNQRDYFKFPMPKYSYAKALPRLSKINVMTNYNFDTSNSSTIHQAEDIAKLSKNSRFAYNYSLINKHHKSKNNVDSFLKNDRIILGNDRINKTPVAIEVERLLRHMLVLGTTGGGKTVFLQLLLYQAMALNSGFLFIDGKGDPKLGRDIRALLRKFNREDDFLHINFGSVESEKPYASNSNTMNLFSYGTAEDFRNLFITLVPDSKDVWSAMARELVFNVLTLMVCEREREKSVITIDKLKDKISLHNMINYYNELVDRGYPNSVLDSMKTFLINRPGITLKSLAKSNEQNKDSSSNSTVQDNADSSKENEIEILTTPKNIHDYLSTSTIESQSVEVDDNDPNKHRKFVIIDEIKALEQHAYLTMQLSPAFSFLINEFGHIFNTTSSEVDLTDVVIHNRCLLVSLPATTKSDKTLLAIGNLLYASLQRVAGHLASHEQEVKKAQANKKLKTPSLWIWDEASYYAPEGVDTFFGQLRSLNIALVLAMQEVKRLEDMNVKVDAVYENINTIVAMKLNSESSIEFITSRCGKHEVKKISRGKLKTLGYEYNNEFENIEVPKIKPDDLKEADRNDGEGFLLIEGDSIPIEVPYIDADLDTSELERQGKTYQLSKTIPIDKPDFHYINRIKSKISPMDKSNHKTIIAQNTDQYFLQMALIKIHLKKVLFDIYLLTVLLRKIDTENDEIKASQDDFISFYDQQALSFLLLALDSNNISHERLNSLLFNKRHKLRTIKQHLREKFDKYGYYLADQLKTDVYQSKSFFNYVKLLSNTISTKSYPAFLFNHIKSMEKFYIIKDRINSTPDTKNISYWRIINYAQQSGSNFSADKAIFPYINRNIDINNITCDNLLLSGFQKVKLKNYIDMKKYYSIVT
ncbi:MULTISPECIES: type IV secretory system conjugative DNA transfer family protein [Cysteiniphilum]|nr:MULTISPECIES: TraM recognition domain-containing protein [Cysteiniphilum]